MVQSDSPARGGSSNPSNPPWIRNWVMRCSLGKYWSRDSERGWQDVWQDVGWQAANPGVHRLSMTHIVGGSEI